MRGIERSQTGACQSAGRDRYYRLLIKIRNATWAVPALVCNRLILLNNKTVHTYNQSTKQWCIEKNSIKLFIKDTLEYF